MRKVISIASLTLLLLLSCTLDAPENIVSRALDIDCSDSSVIYFMDAHGIFPGDGTTAVILAFPDDRVLSQIENRWTPLPFDEETEILLIGKDGKGPYITDDSGNAFLTRDEIKKGCYIIIDSQKDNEGSITDRPSINVSIGIYDSERRYLYYFRMDT